MNELTRIESNELASCELVIEKGMQCFLEVGGALRAIRDGRLYRSEHKTFEEYCQNKWGWRRDYANKLISATEITGNLDTIVSKPATESQARPLSGLPPAEQREVWQRAVETAPNGKVTAAHVAETVSEHKQEKAREEEAKPKAIARFNRTNDNIEWAQWSWNPVTGCKTGCDYCYARDIASRFYREGFEPTFRADRLDAPKNTIPVGGEPGGSAVFVCSMADLFGAWVPVDWINQVMKAVEENPQWTFIFLTKNPRRLRSITFPENAWVGTSVDTQKRVGPAEAAMASVKATVRFVSCEPMLEPLNFANLSIFNWVIIGGRSANSNGPEFQPDPRWARRLSVAAMDAGCQVYEKPNLKCRLREYPTEKK